MAGRPKCSARSYLTGVVIAAVLGSMPAAASAITSVHDAQTAAVRTFGQFAQLPYGVRVRFVVRYLTTHPDRCYGGHSTPRRVAKNIAPAIAGFSPGPDASDGSYIGGQVPVGRAIKHLEANIGC